MKCVRGVCPAPSFPYLTNPPPTPVLFSFFLPPPRNIQAILALGTCLCLCCCMFCVSKKDESNRRSTAGTRLDKIEERTAIDDDGVDEVSSFVLGWAGGGGG